MLNARLTSFILLAALVFSQTLVAGHDPLHHPDNLLDCELCLHVTSAGSAIASNDIPPLFVPACSWQNVYQIDSAILQLIENAHPSRAPPLFSP